MKKIVIYSLILFLLQEIIFRIAFPVPEWKNFNRVSSQVIQNDIYQDPDFFWEDRTWTSILDTNHTFIHHLNEYGFRDNPWQVKKSKGKKRIAFLGDSFIEGTMASQDQSIPAFYQQFREKEAEVFNLGMNGTGIKAYQKVLQEFLPRFKPDEVKLFLYSNDFTSNLHLPSTQEVNLEKYRWYFPRLLILVERFIQGKPIVFRWLKPKHPYLFPVPDQLNPFTNKSHELQVHVSNQIKQAMQDATINYFMVNHLQREERSLRTAVSLKPSLKFIAKLCKSQGTELKVYYIPSRNQISDNYLKFDKESCLNYCDSIHSLMGEEYQIHAKQLKEDCIDLDLQFCDFTPFLREIEKSQKLYWDYDQHMNFQGYRAIASYVVQRE